MGNTLRRMQNKLPPNTASRDGPHYHDLQLLARLPTAMDPAKASLGCTYILCTYIHTTYIYINLYIKIRNSKCCFPFSSLCPCSSFFLKSMFVLRPRYMPPRTAAILEPGTETSSQVAKLWPSQSQREPCATSSSKPAQVCKVHGRFGWSQLHVIFCDLYRIDVPFFENSSNI